MLALLSASAAGAALAQTSISGPPPSSLPQRDGDASSEYVTVDAVGAVDADGATTDPNGGETFRDRSDGASERETETPDRIPGRRTDDRRVRTQAPPIDPSALLRLDRLPRDVPDIQTPDPDSDGPRRARDMPDDRRGVFDPGPARRRFPETRVPPTVGSGEVDLECKKEVQSLRNEIDGKQAQIKALVGLIKTLMAKAKKLESEAQKLVSAAYDTSGPTPRPLTAAEMLANKVKVAALVDQIEMVHAQIDAANDQIHGLKEEIMALEAAIEGLKGCRTG